MELPQRVQMEIDGAGELRRPILRPTIKSLHTHKYCLLLLFLQLLSIFFEPLGENFKAERKGKEVVLCRPPLINVCEDYVKVFELEAGLKSVDAVCVVLLLELAVDVKRRSWVGNLEEKKGTSEQGPCIVEAQTFCQDFALRWSIWTRKLCGFWCYRDSWEFGLFGCRDVRI
ncbi:hypothetical protein SUGI_1138610 [Cryptomeria japonica]|nr:hypothetical protein SUGI_1138610 [Cryptomeria japonica]